MKYYHLTDPVNLKSILENGIYADRSGYIYICNTFSKFVHHAIAFNQLFLEDEVALLQINKKGFTSELEPDAVAEFTRDYQFRVKQPHIHPNHISSSFEFLLDRQYYSDTLSKICTSN
jgi:DNA-binding transcriptional regulator of glucitol operon